LPFADHGQLFTEIGNPPYGPPVASQHEKLVAVWDWIGSQLGGAAAKQADR
jgi:hypothetical protein